MLLHALIAFTQLPHVTVAHTAGHAFTVTFVDLWDTILDYQIVRFSCLRLQLHTVITHTLRLRCYVCVAFVTQLVTFAGVCSCYPGYLRVTFYDYDLPRYVVVDVDC